MFNTIFSAILIALAPTSLGKSLALDPASSTQNMIIQAAAAISAHFAWFMQKRFVSFKQSTQTNQAL